MFVLSDTTVVTHFCAQDIMHYFFIYNTVGTNGYSVLICELILRYNSDRNNIEIRGPKVIKKPRFGAGPQKFGKPAFGGLLRDLNGRTKGGRKIAPS